MMDLVEVDAVVVVIVGPVAAEETLPLAIVPIDPVVGRSSNSPMLLRSFLLT